jgi:glycine/D-amino acid oxidase-like deaminating enzyme
LIDGTTERTRSAIAEAARIPVHHAETSPARLYDTVVIGGGVSGCASAYELAKAGLDVALLERGELNREASGTNAGNVHIQLLSHLNTRPASGEQLAELRAATRLHIEAAAIWRKLEDELETDLGLRLGGGLMIAESDRDLQLLKQKTSLDQELGLETVLLTGDEARRLCPSLSEEVVGAEWCPTEGFVNPLRVAPAFAARAQEQGAEIHVDTAVRAIDVLDRHRFRIQTAGDPFLARTVVIAAGVGAAAIGEMLGLPLPVSGNTLQVHVTEPREPELVQMIQHIGQRLTLKQTQYGTYIIGGGWPGGSEDTRPARSPQLDTILGNVGLAARLMPGLRDVRLLRSWCGVIPVPAGRPLIIGRYERVPGVFVAITGETGLTLGPVVGRLIAELVQGRTASIAIDAFGVAETLRRQPRVST